MQLNQCQSSAALYQVSLQYLTSVRLKLLCNVEDLQLLLKHGAVQLLMP